MAREIVQQGTVPGTTITIRVVRDTGPFGAGVLTDENGWRWSLEREDGYILATNTWSGYGSWGRQFESEVRELANQEWLRIVAARERCIVEAQQKADELAEEADREPEPAAPAPVTEAGMYRTPDGTIYKVQLAVHGSGRLYAKRLELDQDEANGTRGSFEYAPGAIRELTADMRMTLEQAKEFGHIYGVCCKCGRTLTNEESIAAGIGPICAGKW